jgi:hypothetical protein
VEVQKRGLVLPFTWQDLGWQFDAANGIARYHDGRKGHSEPREIPADEQARYEAALEGMKALEAYEHTEWGGPDYGTEVPPPPDTKWVWDDEDEG